VNLGAILRLLPYDLEVMGLNPGNNLSDCGDKAMSI